MSSIALPGWLPCHSSSCRGVKRDLITDADTYFRIQPTIAQPEDCNRLRLPTRRDILKYGLTGAAAVSAQFSGLTTPVAAAEFADFSLWGLGKDLAIETIKTELRPLLHMFLTKAFLPWVDGPVRNFVESFIDILKELSESFFAWLHRCTIAIWPDDESEERKWHHGRSDKLWFDPDRKIPLVKVKNVDRKVGVCNEHPQLEPFDANYWEYKGMANDGPRSGDKQEPEGRYPFLRNVRTKQWKDYKSSFDLLNKIYTKPGDDEWSSDEIEYAVPLVEPGTGKKYTGFSTIRNNERRFYTTYLA